MENIDLTKYNCNYELQFVQFMVEVLKPYIDFQSFDTEEKRINLAGESVPKKGLRIFLKKENGIQESIDENGFIQFIQVDFSTIRSELKEKYTDELTKEQEKKRHFDTITRGNMGPYGGRSKPHDMGQNEYDEKMEYYGYLRKITVNNPSPSEYEKKIRAIGNNTRKLEDIGRNCYGRTKTIQDVLHFLNNVKDHYNFNPIT